MFIIVSLLISSNRHCVPNSLLISFPLNKFYIVEKAQTSCRNSCSLHWKIRSITIIREQKLFSDHYSLYYNTLQNTIVQEICVQINNFNINTTIACSSLYNSSHIPSHTAQCNKGIPCLLGYSVFNCETKEACKNSPLYFQSPLLNTRLAQKCTIQ